MRLVIQRVSEAQVAVNNQVVAKIGQGLLVLIGIEAQDKQEDVSWLVKKLINMRIFEDEFQKMNASVLDITGEILVVSQFTLHASTKKGNRPSFIKAASPSVALSLYEDFISELKTYLGSKVHSGIFGAMMQVSLANNGPVTILMDSKNKE